MEAARGRAGGGRRERAGGRSRGDELVVRTRRPGDRVYWHGREMSLKRLLLERRIPAEERDALPLLAAGSRVLWFPGGILEGRAGDRWIGLRLAASVEAARITR